MKRYHMFINTPTLGFYFPINLQPTAVKSQRIKPPVEQWYIPLMPIGPFIPTRTHTLPQTLFPPLMPLISNLFQFKDAWHANSGRVTNVGSLYIRVKDSLSFSLILVLNFSVSLSELNEWANGGPGSAWSLPKQGSNYQISSAKNAGRVFGDLSSTNLHSEV